MVHRYGRRQPRKYDAPRLHPVPPPARVPSRPQYHQRTCTGRRPLPSRGRMPVALHSPGSRCKQSSGSGSSDVFNGQAAALNPVTDELPTILPAGGKTGLIKLARRSSRHRDDHTERRRSIPMTAIGLRSTSIDRDRPLDVYREGDRALASKIVLP